jgi:PAS domain S-box-containing protein
MILPPMQKDSAAPATPPDSQLFLDAFNASPIGIALEDLDGQPFFVNPALCTMLGFTAEELCRRHFAEFSPADDAEKEWALFQQLKAGSIDRYQLEKRFYRRDGSLIWGRLSISLIRRHGSTHVVAMVEDVTEKKMAQEDLQRSEANLQRVADQLRQRADQLRHLASDLTLAEQHVREQLARALHNDLQQLLFSAGLQLDMFSKRANHATSDESELITHARKYIDEAIASVRTLSVDLFPPALHRGGLPVALPWLADRMRDRYGIIVDLTIDAKADPESRDMQTLVFECVRELLFNVVKHAKVDRAAVDLMLTPDDAVRVTVSDQGAGFDASVKFDRLSSQPVGLGLFSIRERLIYLGGRLEVTSAPGRGARFTVLVPRSATGALRPVGTDELLANVSKGAAFEKRGGVHRRSLRIVIADDHPAMRQSVRALLSSQPAFSVVGEAVDGYEAVAQAHALQPDVIVMDVSMPRLDGVEATRRIHAELPLVHILGLSVYEPLNGSHPIERAGATAFFTKGDLQGLVERLLALQAGELPPENRASI